MSAKGNPTHDCGKALTGDHPCVALPWDDPLVLFRSIKDIAATLAEVE